jgi:hypothetical protein
MIGEVRVENQNYKEKKSHPKKKQRKDVVPYFLLCILYDDKIFKRILIIRR